MLTMLMTLLIIFMFGLIHGSFLNVLIHRLPRKISINNPRRSECPKCGHMISIYDNIPLFSWIFLFGKCRHCKANISIRYPIVELLSGLAIVLSVWHFGLTPTAFLVYLFVSILLVITLIDIDFMIIPDVINKPGMIFGLIIGLINEFTNIFSQPITTGIIDSALGGVLGYGVLYIIAWSYFKLSGVSGLGGGDIKLMGFTGTLLGVQSIFPSLLIASFSGAIVGVVALLFKGRGLRTEIPFGPWLAFGILLHMFGVDPSSYIEILFN